MLARMLPVVRFLGAASLSYAIGCLPIANSVARRHGVADLRTIGDHNPGYWNAREQVGIGASAPIFVGDVAKGAVAVALARSVRGPWWVGYVAGGAAMVGHAFPAFDGWRGGRSVLTFVGAATVYAPLPAAVSVAALGATWTATHRFDVAARAGIAAFPFLQCAIEGPKRTAASGVLMSFVGLRFAQARSAAPGATRRDGAEGNREPSKGVGEG